MIVKGKIADYRERLDKTLASHDLTDEEALKALVKDHILRSSEHETQESMEYVVEKRTTELSNLLSMMRSASESNEGVPQHATWKLKQDTEEIRVMYREGPEGSPFHTLLVEGYVDAPVDACLCISVEAALYPTWFPETRIPTFKVMLSQCLRRIRIGENISLVRMKLSWPLSNREALMHYFEFEYLEDGLVIVVINTPDVESIQKEIHDFSNDEIPEAGQTVRVDLVGGFALQKVTQDRSYFRTIANMDVKLDFVPPSLINFVSRQLIGTGFKLYKKILTSKSKDDVNIAEALNDPLYTRIRKALYSNTEPSSNANMMIGNGDPLSSPKELGNPVQDEVKDEQVPGSDHVSESSPEYKVSANWKTSSEIEEEEIQEVKSSQKDDSENQQITEKGSMSATNQPKANHVLEEHSFNHKNIRVSPQVQQALGTLDKAISIIREARISSHAFGPSSFPGKESPKAEMAEAKCSTVEDCGDIHLDITAPLTPRKAERIDRNSQDFSSTRDIHNLRLSPLAKEVNPNRLAPGSPELVLLSSNGSPQVASHLNGSGSMGTPNSDKTADDDNVEVLATNADGIHDNGATVHKKTGQHKKWRMCCLHLVSGRLVSS